MHIIADNVSVIGDSQVPPFPAIDGEYASLWSSGLEITGQNAVVQGLEIRKFSSAGIIVFDASPSICGNIVHDIGFAAVEVVGPEPRRRSPDRQQPDLFRVRRPLLPRLFQRASSSAPGDCPARQARKSSTTPSSVAPSCTGGESSGVYASDLYCTPEIKYNIVADFPGFGVGCTPFVQNLVSDYNNVWNNGQNFGTDCPGGVYDISQYPMFTADGDYKLEPGSPCVDYIPFTESDPVDYDLENNPRLASSCKDIGCYELQTASIVPRRILRRYPEARRLRRRAHARHGLEDAGARPGTNQRGSAWGCRKSVHAPRPSRYVQPRQRRTGRSSPSHTSSTLTSSETKAPRSTAPAHRRTGWSD